MDFSVHVPCYKKNILKNISGRFKHNPTPTPTPASAPQNYSDAVFFIYLFLVKRCTTQIHQGPWCLQVFPALH